MLTRDPDVTKLLDRLEARGLVTRERQQRDRRVIVARIIDEALKILSGIDRPVLELTEGLLGHLGERRLKTWNAQLFLPVFLTCLIRKSIDGARQKSIEVPCSNGLASLHHLAFAKGEKLMRLSTRLILSCCLVVTSLATAWLLIPVQLVTAVGNNSPADKNKSATVRARATVRGAPGSGIEGVVTFKERKGDFPEPGVEIVARVKGLTPGHHGMHIHEIANCSNVSPTGTIGAFLGAGGHFDPGPFGMSHPDANHPFHMGDIPNLEVNAGGVGHLTHTSSRITLSPGPLSVFDANGSAIIVHAGPDLGTTGVAGGSGGARLACGVIEQVSGGDKDDEN